MYLRRHLHVCGTPCSIALACVFGRMVTAEVLVFVIDSSVSVGSMLLMVSMVLVVLIVLMISVLPSLRSWFVGFDGVDWLPIRQPCFRLLVVVKRWSARANNY